jgi:hypothetical protein
MRGHVSGSRSAKQTRDIHGFISSLCHSFPSVHRRRRCGCGLNIKCSTVVGCRTINSNAGGGWAASLERVNDGSSSVFFSPGAGQKNIARDWGVIRLHNSRDSVMLPEMMETSPANRNCSRVAGSQQTTSTIGLGRICEFFPLRASLANQSEPSSSIFRQITLRTCGHPFESTLASATISGRAEAVDVRSNSSHGGIMAVDHTRAKLVWTRLMIQSRFARARSSQGSRQMPLTGEFCDRSRR